MEVEEIIMSIKEILWLVALCVVGLCAIITTLVAVVRFIRKKKNGEPVTLESVFQEISESAMEFIGDAESAYKALTGATGVKAGTFKLENVLNKLRDLCAEKGVSFDKTYWTDYIEKAVRLINIDRKTEEKSTETTTETKTPVA